MVKKKATLNFDVKEILDTLRQDVILPAAKDGAKTAQQVSKNLAPKNTGKLANSITATATDNKSEIVMSNAAGVEYAIYQELGTSKLVGKHFIRRGALKSLEIIEKSLEKNLEQTYDN